MTLTLERPTAGPATGLDAIAEAIADVEGLDELGTQPQPVLTGETKPRDLLLICSSGELEKTWSSLLLATTAAASGINTKIFLTFWGLQAFVKDEKRITGGNAMQKMLAITQRPGISHRRLSRMNFLGIGPWVLGVLAKRYGVAKPKELLEAAQALGVEFMPCQMTMDMFGLKREDMIDGMGEPVGAATVLGLIRQGWTPLCI
ncbi:MAG TPA: DsrE/DsrF/DrsH-like family protein [Candidatus Limnocylindrales bacterium]